MNDVDPDRPMHRLFDYASSIQGDPYLDIEVDTMEGRWDDSESGSPEAYRIRKNALGWRL